ncbi:MAG: ISL3 family transposase [Clostridia bacterium]|nr:ISL3 family transposase [Clostridia bacterium]
MNGFTNYEEMFAQSIGLTDPWQIERAEFEEAKREVHVYVKARKTAKYPCPKCGKQCNRYDDEEDERVWRHGDVVFFPCYVHCRRPRIKCDDGIHVVTAPWTRPGSRYTLLFESYAMLLAQSMPVNQARKLLRISHTSLTAILRYWVKKAVREDDLRDVRSICVDETSFRKGQSYVTVISDAVKRRVIDVEDGRDAETVERFSYKLEEKGGDCGNIRTYISDMSSAYESARDLCFPNATQIIDKFHVKQLMLQAMDEVRRSEQGKTLSRSKRSGKKLLMIPEKRLTEQQQTRINELSKQYPKTGRAYRMVQVLDEMYKCTNPDDAEAVFNRMVSWLRRSRLEPMKRVALSLKQRKATILAYFKHRVTNAIAEAINSLIQAAKRKARGFRTFEGYACMIYLVVGKLKLDCTPLFP